MAGQRLDKLVADNGMLSRKQAKEQIRGGRVRVDGVVVRSGDYQVKPEDAVTLDGKLIRNQDYLYIMMNKPAGVLSATRDREQPTVLELLPDGLRRKNLFPAGRLDKDTEGLLLITDDGDFAHYILSPVNRIPKTYYAELSGEAADLQAVVAGFAGGVNLGGGEICSPAELIFDTSGGTLAARVTIYEGMYHQVKRMFTKFSLSVTVLKRIQMGGLPLDENLAAGNAREIMHKELRQIAYTFDRFRGQK
jgi:16S rRNA pseudouridine516 synthase